MSILPSLSLLNQISRFILAKKEGKFLLNYGLFLLSWKSGLRVSEAIGFDYQLKHPRHKDLYLVKGKGNKKRYVYVSPAVISELKTNHWQPNQTNRFAFNHFLGKVKEKINIPANVELTPHTLRRCFTTHNALNGVPMPILQKSLGHVNIKTTSFYWKGSVDIREFGGWLEPNFSPREPEEVPRMEIIPKSPKVVEIPTNQPEITLSTSPLLEKDPVKPKLLLTIEKLKRELAEKDKQLQNKDSEISLLTSENKKLKALNQKKDRKLKELQEKIKDLSIENYSNLKNTAKNMEKGKRKQELENKIFSPNTLSKVKKPKNNSLITKESPQDKLLNQIQVWKPPN